MLITLQTVTAGLHQSLVLVALQFRSDMKCVQATKNDIRAYRYQREPRFEASELQSNQDRSLWKPSSQFEVQGRHDLPNLDFTNLN